MVEDKISVLHIQHIHSLCFDGSPWLIRSFYLPFITSYRDAGGGTSLYSKDLFMSFSSPSRFLLLFSSHHGTCPGGGRTSTYYNDLSTSSSSPSRFLSLFSSHHGTCPGGGKTSTYYNDLSISSSSPSRFLSLFSSHCGTLLMCVCV